MRSNNVTPTPKPIAFNEYPKWLEHPNGKGNFLPPVIVNDRDQEAQYVSIGYSAAATDDAFSFITARATEKADSVIRDVAASLRKSVSDGVESMHEAARDITNKATAEFADAIDDLAHGQKRINVLEHEIASLRKDVNIMREIVLDLRGKMKDQEENKIA